MIPSIHDPKTTKKKIHGIFGHLKMGREEFYHFPEIPIRIGSERKIPKAKHLGSS